MQQCTPVANPLPLTAMHLRNHLLGDELVRQLPESVLLSIEPPKGENGHAFAHDSFGSESCVESPFHIERNGIPSPCDTSADASLGMVSPRSSIDDYAESEGEVEGQEEGDGDGDGDEDDGSLSAGQHYKSVHQGVKRCAQCFSLSTSMSILQVDMVTDPGQTKTP